MVSEVLVVALPSLYFLESLEESFGCGLGLLPFGRSKGGCVERHVRSLSVRGKEESGVLRIDQVDERKGRGNKKRTVDEGNAHVCTFACSRTISVWSIGRRTGMNVMLVSNPEVIM
jgi:hypothetical protein